MEDIRHAIRQGRVLANEGLYDHAIETWKMALNRAYTLQDYAGMFVLSVAIGEACVRLAMRAKEANFEDGKLLKEAVANLDYALQIVMQCSLYGILMDYRVLYQGVRRAEALRRQAQQLIDQGQQRKKKLSCSTCGKVRDGLVMDKNDGCYYCKRCYEEYYATEHWAESKDAIESATADTNGRAKDGSLEVVIRDLNLVEKPEIEVNVVGESEKKKQVVPETADCVRYERKELGSLADYLVGRTRLGAMKQYGDQQDDECKSMVDFDESFGAIIEHTEEASIVKEDDDNYSDKCMYTIAQLVELRQYSPVDCPSALLTSPVRDDGTALPQSRNRGQRLA